MRLEAVKIMDVLEAMESARSIRSIRSDDVPEELIAVLIRAATRAPSPGNSQGWDFVVVRDRDTKARLGKEMGANLRAMRSAVDPEPTPAAARMAAGADRLLETLVDVPVVIFVCGRIVYPPAMPMEEFVWSALYPATQNLLLAARSLGLAAPMTTFHMAAEPLVRELLGIPDDVKIAATIPVGWPAAPFGPVRRKPISEVMHTERWDSRG